MGAREGASAAGAQEEENPSGRVGVSTRRLGGFTKEPYGSCPRESRRVQTPGAGWGEARKGMNHGQSLALVPGISASGQWAASEGF